MFRNLCLLPPGILAFLCTFIELTDAQLPPIVVCAPGQCLQGYSNITSFGNATSINLPLDLALNPGIAIFPQPLYAGQSAFVPLPISANSSLSTPLSTIQSITLSSNTWIALDNRVLLWDSMPNMRDLPFGNNISSLPLIAIQSSACSPACSSMGGVCWSSGTCACLPGFTACKSGSTQDANDRTKCTPVPTSMSSLFVPKAASRMSCSGGTSNDCTVCAPNMFAFNGGCMRASADGMCEGSMHIVDNNKHSCDACPAKCSACRIPDFDQASMASKLHSVRQSPTMSMVAGEDIGGVEGVCIDVYFEGWLATHNIGDSVRQAVKEGQVDDEERCSAGCSLSSSALARCRPITLF
ncbi:hypothetical protein BDN71DRAFT_1510004 [Pleurotus eryngii]|uniref:Uncharacterized protein n=1 Tax=Pleurotus eryngii TaxID=5323 RepID=A0A9P6DCK9_PLEER|nr:hypothetical protein BDN71DRAFT_1510004 [Pleurotus eryngii]